MKITNARKQDSIQLNDNKKDDSAKWKKKMHTGKQEDS